MFCKDTKNNFSSLIFFTVICLFEKNHELCHTERDEVPQKAMPTLMPNDKVSQP